LSASTVTTSKAAPTAGSALLTLASDGAPASGAAFAPGVILASDAAFAPDGTLAPDTAFTRGVTLASDAALAPGVTVASGVTLLAGNTRACGSAFAPKATFVRAGVAVIKTPADRGSAPPP
jgi:hypothetical protein